jgi:myo-inositol-1(or 4)-monophosphatase
MNIQPIKDAIFAAGKVVRNANPTKGIMQKSGGYLDFVTGADLEVEKILKTAIQKNFPSHEILSEETTSDIKDPLSVDHLWVMDPIDGTVNFRYERNYSAISVAYVEKGEVQAGMVLNPFRNEFFHAEKEKGSFVDERKIHVSDQLDINKSTLYMDNNYNPKNTRITLEMLLNLPQLPWILLEGSAILSLCDVAAGRGDLYFNRKLKPWDNAAAFIIIEEAGGTILNLKGEKINFMSEEVIAGNPDLVQNFVKAIT